MPTKSDESKTRAQVESSRRKRRPVGVKPVTASMQQKRATSTRTKGRAVHGRTKSLADAKAAKPGTGKKVQRWKTGPNGGEDQTTNGVGGTGRGADGKPPRGRVSRKSTRGSWPAGEKRSAPLTTRTKNAVNSQKARAQRGK